MTDADAIRNANLRENESKKKRMSDREFRERVLSIADNAQDSEQLDVGLSLLLAERADRNGDA